MKGKINNNRKKIVRDLAAGKNQADIAKEIGIVPSSICRFAKREDVKREVEIEALRLLEALPDAVGNVKGLVQGMKDIPLKDYKNSELGYKASLRVLESAGIVHTPAQNQTMINIFNDNRVQVSPIIQKLLEAEDIWPSDPSDN